MPSIASSERAALADLLEDLGPEAPTLCQGWTTRDLAAHLAARERRMDALPGVALKPLAGHLARVQRGYAQRPFAELVHLVRSGPPRWSWFGLPGADRAFNAAEFFVHHEDVRRAQPGWSARQLPDKVQAGLWSIVRAQARLTYRRAGCGVALRRPGTEPFVACQGEPTAVVTGEPAEVLLHAFGRRGHALVEVSGPAEARALLERAPLSI